MPSATAEHLRIRGLQVGSLASPFLGLLAGCGAVGAAAQEVGRELARVDLAKAIDDFMSRTVTFGFSGSILVAKQGRIILAKGYGRADRACGVPYTERAVFSIGSITKQFTAAAILRLEMDGRLDVHDSIARHLPAVPPDKSAITLHHLLTHTSGLESDFGQGDHETVTRDEFVRRVLESKLQSEPGSAFAYSNAGYGVLAAIIEIVSGEPYESFIKEHLFLPAGMTSTGHADPGWERELLPHGYESGQDQGTALEQAGTSSGPFWNLIGNGGLQSTLGDLYRWDRALLGTRVLSEDARAAYFTPYASAGSGERYAYGWYVSETPWHTRLIAHTGGDGIFFAGLRRYVDDDVTIIHSSNVASLLSEYHVRSVESIVFSRPCEMPPPVVAMPAAPHRFEGRFRLPSGGEASVAVEGDELHVTPNGQDAFAALAGVASADGASLARHQEKTEAALRERDRGNFAPLADVAADGSTASDLANGWERYRREQAPARGDYLGFVVLGSRPAGTWTLTHVRLRFTRGDLLLDYLWNGGKLLGVQHSLYPGYCTFLPTGEQSFASYDITSGKSVALACAPGSMSISSRGQTLSATRVE